MGKFTDSVHLGFEGDKQFNSVNPPIYQTSTFFKNDFDDINKHDYTRVSNPTREVLENAIAKLEKGKYGLAFSSGVAAVQSIMGLLKSGDKILASQDLYGGTLRLFNNFFSNYGIDIVYHDFDSLSNISDSLLKEVKIIYFETPTNPLLKIYDISKIAEFARKHNLISVIDNTFATPFNQNPLVLGIDLVIHSSSKFLSGHSDIIGGLTVTNSLEINDKLKYVQKVVGGIPSPFDCWLIFRSMKTFAVRMEKHNSNAILIAEKLKSVSNIKHIYYPILNKDRELAEKQMNGFGAVITIELNENVDYKKFIKNLKLIKLAESLGGVESLINQSYSMSHGSIPHDEKLRAGINERVFRISVGLEDVDDIYEDILTALSL